MGSRIERRTRPSPAGGIIAATGAVVVVAGAFLPWVAATVSPPSPDAQPATAGSIVVTVSGLDRDGKYTLALGLIALGAAIVSAIARRRGLRFGVATVALLAGLACLADVGANLALADRQADRAFDAAAAGITELGTVDAQTPAQLREAITVGYVYGIYVTGAGALAIVAGGIVVLATRGRAPAAITSLEGSATTDL